MKESTRKYRIMLNKLARVSLAGETPEEAFDRLIEENAVDNECESLKRRIDDTNKTFASHIKDQKSLWDELKVVHRLINIHLNTGCGRYNQFCLSEEDHKFLLDYVKAPVTELDLGKEGFVGPERIEE